MLNNYRTLIRKLLTVTYRIKNYFRKWDRGVNRIENKKKLLAPGCHMFGLSCGLSFRTRAPTGPLIFSSLFFYFLSLHSCYPLKGEIKRGVRGICGRHYIEVSSRDIWRSQTRPKKCQDSRIEFPIADQSSPNPKPFPILGNICSDNFRNDVSKCFYLQTKWGLILFWALLTSFSCYCHRRDILFKKKTKLVIILGLISTFGPFYDSTSTLSFSHSNSGQWSPLFSRWKKPDFLNGWPSSGAFYKSIWA